MIAPGVDEVEAAPGNSQILDLLVELAGEEIHWIDDIIAVGILAAPPSRPAWRAAAALLVVIRTGRAVERSATAAGGGSLRFCSCTGAG